MVLLKKEMIYDKQPLAEGRELNFVKVREDQH